MKQFIPQPKFLLLLLIGSMLLAACEPLQTPPPQVEGMGTDLFAPAQTPEARLETSSSAEEAKPPTETGLASSGEGCLALSPSLPSGFRRAMQDRESVCPANSPDLAATFGVDAENPVQRWVYVPVARFPTLTDDLSLDELLAVADSGEGTSFTRVLIKAEDAEAFKTWSLWYELNLEPLPAEQILDALWEDPSALALIPFEDLEPRLKLISLDGSSPLDPGFDPETWPLSMPIGLQRAYNSVPEELIQNFAAELPANWQADKLTDVMVTGVTALARATAVDMERYGVLYPQAVIGDTLRGADILHISNEVSFAENCPDPVGIMPNLIFCSKDRYLRLLEDIGTDVVELTGDHMNDWGPEALAHTLELYETAGLPVYGGGANAAQAALPITFETKGNKIAFIGCNAKGVYSANAGTSTGGANPCNMPEFSAQIEDLSEQGYNVIATFQHYEGYGWSPEPAIVRDFNLAAEAGAVIVSGSQAHRPHSMAFSADGKSMLRYGLGNLFFDQLDVGSDTDKAFIDQHFFYENRHISTRLTPIYFTDYSQPKFPPTEIADALLQALFSTSGW